MRAIIFIHLTFALTLTTGKGFVNFQITPTCEPIQDFHIGQSLTLEELCSSTTIEIERADYSMPMEVEVEVYFSNTFPLKGNNDRLQELLIQFKAELQADDRFVKVPPLMSNKIELKACGKAFLIFVVINELTRSEFIHLDIKCNDEGYNNLEMSIANEPDGISIKDNSISIEGKQFYITYNETEILQPRTPLYVPAILASLIYDDKNLPLKGLELALINEETSFGKSISPGSQLELNVSRLYPYEIFLEGMHVDEAILSFNLEGVNNSNARIQVSEDISHNADDNLFKQGCSIATSGSRLLIFNNRMGSTDIFKYEEETFTMSQLEELKVKEKAYYDGIQSLSQKEKMQKLNLCNWEPIEQKTKVNGVFLQIENYAKDSIEELNGFLMFVSNKGKKLIEGLISLLTIVKDTANYFNNPDESNLEYLNFIFEAIKGENLSACENIFDDDNEYISISIDFFEFSQMGKVQNMVEFPEVLYNGTCIRGIQFMQCNLEKRKYYNKFVRAFEDIWYKEESITNSVLIPESILKNFIAIKDNLKDKPFLKDLDYTLVGELIDFEITHLLLTTEMALLLGLDLNTKSDVSIFSEMLYGTLLGDAAFISARLDLPQSHVTFVIDLIKAIILDKLDNFYAIFLTISEIIIESGDVKHFILSELGGKPSADAVCRRDVGMYLAALKEELEEENSALSLREYRNEYYEIVNGTVYSVTPMSYGLYLWRNIANCSCF